MIPLLRCCLHTLLMLLLIASGVLVAVQNAQHGGVHDNTHDVSQVEGLGWHAHGHTHSDHASDSHDHDEAVPDDGDHEQHFHVHLPLQAVPSALSALEWAGVPVVQLSLNPLAPHSLKQAPPVPPPNA